MASNTEFVKSVLMLDGTQVSKVLQDLDTKAKKLGEDMVKALQAGDDKSYKALGRELKSVERQMAGIKKGAFNVQNVLKNLNGTNLKDLQRAQRSISAEMNMMTRNTKEYTAKAADLQKVEAELKKVKTEMHGVSAAGGSMWSKTADGFNKYFGMATAFIASFTGLVFGIKKSVDAFNEFESKVAELSSLTGLAGDDLNWLSNKAKELSVSVTESGVRITSSAVDIVDGFKLMGSARPELLKNKEALAQVTEGALVLAEAAKIDMQSAVDAVAASMNQFNLDATQTDRVINSIAAGALEGSAEIADLTESLGNVGTVAAQSNMSLEQTVAALEVLSAKQLKGAEAGTQFRGALLNMKQASVGYQSGAFNMRDALEEVNLKLANMGSDMERDALLQKIFGDRNITVGNILLQNVGTYDQLTQAVTGTNVATQQAITNTDTNAAKLAQAKNRAHEVSIELGEKLAPAMTLVTGWGTKLLSSISAIVDVVVKYRSVLIPTIATIAAYTASIALAAAAKKAYATAVNIAKFATEGFNKVSKANVFGVITAGLSLAISLFSEFSSKTKTAVQNISDFTSKLNEQRFALEEDFKALKKTNEGTEARKKAITEINEKYGEYLPFLLTEKSSLDDITTAQNAANESMIKSIALKSKNEDITATIQKSQAAIKEISDKIIGDVIDEKGSVFGGAATGALLDSFGKIRKGLSTGYKESAKFMEQYGRFAKLDFSDVVDQFNEVHSIIYNEQQEVKKLNEYYDAYVKSLGASILPGDPKAKKDEYTANEQLINQLKLYNAQIGDNSNVLVKFNNAQINYLSTVDKLNESLKAGTISQKQYDAELAIAEQEKTAAAKDYAEAQQNKAKKDEYTANEQLINQLKLYNAQIGDNSNVLVKFNNAQINYLSTVDKLNESLKAGTISQKQYDAELAIAEQEKTAAAKDYAEAQQKNIDDYNKAHKKTIVGADRYKDAELEREKQRAKESADFRISEEKRTEAEKEQIRAKSFEAVSAVVQATHSIYSSSLDSQLQKIQTASDADAAAKEKELSNKKLTEAQKEAIEKKYAIREAAREKERRKIARNKAIADKAAAAFNIMLSTAQAIMKAVAEFPATGGMPFVAIDSAIGAAQLAAVLAQPLPQAAKGKYPVLGADDGKTYNAGVVTNAKTGLLTGPTILAGEQPEIIIDTKTTRRMQMDYPGLINAIYMLSGRMPQHATGKYPTQNTSATAPIIQSDPMLLSVMQEISRKLDNPARAKVVYTEFEEIKTKVDETRANFNG